MNNIKAPVVITDKVFRDFEIFLQEYEINYRLPGEKDLSKLKIALKSIEDFVFIILTDIKYLLYC